MKPCRCPFVRNAPARQRRWESLDWIHTTPSQRESPSINGCPAPEKRAIGESKSMWRSAFYGGCRVCPVEALRVLARLRLKPTRGSASLDRKLDNAALTHPGTVSRHVLRARLLCQ